MVVVVVVASLSIHHPWRPPLRCRQAKGKSWERGDKGERAVGKRERREGGGVERGARKQRRSRMLSSASAPSVTTLAHPAEEGGEG